MFLTRDKMASKICPSPKHDTCILNECSVWVDSPMRDCVCTMEPVAIALNRPSYVFYGVDKAEYLEQRRVYDKARKEWREDMENCEYCKGYGFVKEDTGKCGLKTS